MKINTNSWNRIRYTIFAPIYDRVARFGVQRRRSILLLDLEAGERLLIVGAGTGADLPFVPGGVEITAGDITPAMVQRIRERAESLRLLASIDVMDGQALPLPDAHFDAVILHLIVAVIPDPVACLREVARVLKPGGKVAVFDKFVPDGERPSWLRRGVNVVTVSLFSDITRSLRPLLAGTDLRQVHREPAALGGNFQIALLRKGDGGPGGS